VISSEVLKLETGRGMVCGAVKCPLRLLVAHSRSNRLAALGCFSPKADVSGGRGESDFDRPKREGKFGTETDAVSGVQAAPLATGSAYQLRPADFPPRKLLEISRSSLNSELLPLRSTRPVSIR
jgi:hypothetical protein